MKLPVNIRGPRLWRTLVQWAFFLWIVFIGVQFFLFVRHFETGAGPVYLRPPGVEGFLPIGALVSLKHWFASGEIHPVHPAALVLFVTFVGMSLLARKAFCSWLCPVGTLSEAAGDLGRRLLGRNFRMWGWLDLVLRGAKYALLLFFVKIILWDMPAFALGSFLDSSYWAVSDVKMLHFFTGLSGLALGILAGLTVLSLFFRNFWCRYLCPYGALLGIFSLFSPLAVRRNGEKCSDCGACSRACPSRLAVHRKSSVLSAECTGCLSCIESCSRSGALQISPPFWRRRFPWYAFAGLVLVLFAAGVGAGMLTGHWQSSLTYDDYRMLIPLAERIGH